MRAEEAEKQAERDAEAAKIEAWEEAGVAKGRVGKAAIAGYMTEKRYDDGRRVPCHVSVYRIDVTAMTETYPEANMRKRKWMSPGKAAKKVSDPGLKEILQTIT